MRTIVAALAVSVLAACSANGGGGGGGGSGGGGGGSAGGGGGSAGGCSSASCNGCCDAGGVCQPGDSVAACGGGGSACMSCLGGSTCASGQCQPPPSRGTSWRQATASAAFGPRAAFAFTVHNGEMWIAGGSYGSINYSDVWHSADGVTWAAATGSAAFGAVTGACLASFNGSLWLLRFDATLWTSPDGATWTKQANNAPFGSGGDLQAGCVAWNGALWLAAGGGTTSTMGGQVWSAPDGQTWTKQADSYGSTMSPSRLVTFGNKLYTVGAGVYASSDGVTWVPTRLGLYAYDGVVAAGALWTVTAGLDGVVLSSPDGATWTTSQATLPFNRNNSTTSWRIQYGWFAFAPSGGTDTKLWVVAGAEPYVGPGSQNLQGELADVWVSP